MMEEICNSNSNSTMSVKIYFVSVCGVRSTDDEEQFIEALSKWLMIILGRWRFFKRLEKVYSILFILQLKCIIMIIIIIIIRSDQIIT